MKFTISTISVFSLLVLLPFLGCATVDARRDYDNARDQVERAIGHAPDIQPDEQSQDAEQCAALISDGLTVDEAVQVALLNNSKVRAAFARIGMSRSDVVQAGLFSNPSIGLSFRFPDGGGLADFELSLAQNIADLWMIPARTRAATRDLNRTILEAVREVSALANDTKVAYVNAVAADELLATARDSVTLTQQLLRITEARLEAGMVSSLDANLAKGQVLKAEVELRTARLEAATAHRTLATLLGLVTQAGKVTLADPLPTPRSDTLDPERYVEIARDARLDLQAARDGQEAAAARVELELARVFQNVEIGFELERNARRAPPGRKVLADTARASIANGGLTVPEIESRGQRRLAKSQEIEAILGPSLSLTLPIFDQNQAQIAKARFGYLEAKYQLDALDRAIVQETREAADRAATAWNLATLYDHEVLPQVRETLTLSEAAYQAGNAPILNVVDAQRSLLEARRLYVAALQSSANALVDLERATARPIRVLLDQTKMNSQPASAPGTTTMEDNQ